MFSYLTDRPLKATPFEVSALVFVVEAVAALCTAYEKRALHPFHEPLADLMHHLLSTDKNRALVVVGRVIHNSPHFFI